MAHAERISDHISNLPSVDTTTHASLSSVDAHYSCGGQGAISVHELQKNISKAFTKTEGSRSEVRRLEFIIGVGGAVTFSTIVWVAIIGATIRALG